MVCSACRIQQVTQDDVKMVESMNDKHRGKFKVFRTHKKGHMWDAQMFIRWLWEIAGPTYRSLRKKYGLEGVWGMLLADAFGGYTSKSIRSELLKWSEAFLVHILGVTWGPEVPGGWSAPGQPNDAFHQFLHLIRKAYERIAVNYKRNALLRIVFSFYYMICILPYY